MKTNNSLALVMTGFCVALFLASCASEDVTVPNEVATNVLPENYNPIALKVGNSWTYREMEIDNGARKFTGKSDTTRMQWHSLRLTKDTVIGGIPFALVEEVRKKKNGDDSLLPSGSRSAIYSDSFGITEVQFTYDNQGMLLFAGRRSVGDSLRNSHIFFYDIFAPIVFPLIKGDTFYYRPKGISSFSEKIKQVYLGQYEIQTQEGLKPAWEFGRVYFDSTLASMFSNAETWVGVNGLLRRKYTIDTVLVYDHSGGTHYVQGTVITDYWGAGVLPVDTLNN